MRSRRQTFVLVWWFLTILSSSNEPTVTGPFADQGTCLSIRNFVVAKLGPLGNEKVSACWSDGRP